jgi:cytochrome c6
VPRFRRGSHTGRPKTIFSPATKFQSDQNLRIQPTEIMITAKSLRLLALGFSLTTAVGFAASAGENWENLCAKCHAPDGSGSTKIGKKLKLKDYSDASVQAAIKDEDMVKAIKEGVTADGKERMKSFKGDLTDPEVADLVAYIRKLKK